MHSKSPDKRAKILVVEDDDLLREVLCKMLEQEGYDVDVAENGDDALEKIEQVQYTTIILDLVFRKKYIQGAEVLNRVYAAFPKLPVIVISGKASDETLIKTVMTGGAFSFILKPFPPAIILDAVASAVQKETIANHLSGTVSEQTDHLLIKGVASDLHVFVKQYGTYFEQYLWHFYGIRAKPLFDSDFDIIRVTFDSEHPQTELYHWFCQYLAFTEQSDPVDPVVSTPRTKGQVLKYTEQLNLQIKHFAANIESAYWRASFETADNSPDTAAFYLNPLKVVNSLQLKTRKSVFDTVRNETAGIVSQVNELISNAETLQAFVLLINFCNKYEEPFAAVKKEIFLLKYRLSRTLNGKRLNMNSEAWYNMELDNVHNALLFDILPRMEKIAVNRA